MKKNNIIFCILALGITIGLILSIKVRRYKRIKRIKRFNEHIEYIKSITTSYGNGESCMEFDIFERDKERRIVEYCTNNAEEEFTNFKEKNCEYFDTECKIKFEEYIRNKIYEKKAERLRIETEAKAIIKEIKRKIKEEEEIQKMVIKMKAEKIIKEEELKNNNKIKE